VSAEIHFRHGCSALAERDLVAAYAIRPSAKLAALLKALSESVGDIDTYRIVSRRSNRRIHR
jgi:hypothetical protein